MIFVDTNILIYAAGEPHPFKDRCVRLLKLHAKKAVVLSCNVEVLQEILHYFQRGKRLALGLSLLKHIQDLNVVAYPVQHRDMRFASDLLPHFPDVPVRDFIHASTMLNYNMDQIYSFDKDFDRLPGIRRIEPE